MPLAATDARPSIIRDPIRLAALRATGLLEPGQSAWRALTSLGDATCLAARVMDAPIAFVTLVAQDRLVLASVHGQAEQRRALREITWSDCLCVRVVESEATLLVEDALTDPDLAALPAVRDAGFRAYVGVPLATEDGHVLGTLSVVDVEPRRWDPATVEELHAIARLFGAKIDLRQRRAELARAESELSESRRVRDVLLESSPDCVQLLTPEGRIESMNAPGLMLMEVDDPTSLIGADWVAVWPTDGRAAAAQAVERARDGGTVRFTGACPSLKGTSKWWDVTIAPVRGEAGMVERLLVVSREVTAAKQREAALRESEARLAEAQRVGRIGSWDLDLQTRVVRWSAEFFRLCGLAPRPALSLQDVIATVHPDDRTRMQELLLQAIVAERDYEFSYRVLQPDGACRLLRGRAEMVRDAGGRVLRVVGTAQDVTEQAAAESALRASEARLRLAMSVAGMIAWERDLRTDRISDAATDEEGLRLGHAIPEPLRDYENFLAAVHPDDRARVARANEDAIARGGTFSVAYRIQAPDGSTRWHETSARAITDEDGQPTCLVGVSLDVTERARLEEQLRQSQKMEAIGQLAGGVAHDFNNLLTVILASTRFALESLPTDAAAREELAAIDDAAGRAVQLTRQLLAFSRKQILKPEPLDLNGVVRGLEPMLRRLIGEDIVVLMLPGAALWPVLADPGQLEQVLVNLAVNARDAMPHGGRLVIETANLEPTATEGRRVRLTVRDTGVGMSESTLSHVFEPFFTTKETGKGTGLGLSTVYGIVQQSGGSVSVSSTPGRGTAFEIDLPASQESPPDVQPAPAPAVPPASHGTVLLVEDEPGVRSIARRILERSGYQVLVASQGRDALRVAREHAGPIDLLLTDLVMPVMGGRELSERLSGEGREPRVLFMSGYTEDEIIRRSGFPAGTHFLEKPFTAEGLAAAVRTALER